MITPIASPAPAGTAPLSVTAVPVTSTVSPVDRACATADSNASCSSAVTSPWATP